MMEEIVAIQAGAIAWLIWKHVQCKQVHISAGKLIDSVVEVVKDNTTTIAKLSEQPPKPKSSS